MAGARSTGRNEATESSVLRMPKIRPRTSAGRSSWSAVCAGIATKAYSMPAKVAITTTIAMRLTSGAIAGTTSSIGPTAGAEGRRDRPDRAPAA